MTVENGKFYFIKDESFDLFKSYPLMQNIFPTTEKYIASKYQTRKQDVEIAETLKSEIIQTSYNVIRLAEKGINIPFYDIIEMKNILLEKEQ